MKKHIAPAILLLLIFALPTLSPAQDAWKEYKYPKDNILFSSPVEPKVATTSEPIDGGKMVVHAYSMKTANDCVLVTAVTNYYPASMMERFRDLKSIQEGVQTFLNTIHGEIIVQKNITLFGYPAIQFSFHNERGQGSMLMCMTATRSYVVYYVVPGIANDTTPDDATRFFSSFRVLKP